MIKKQLINNELDNLICYLKNIYFNLENPNEYVEFVKKEILKKRLTCKLADKERKSVIILEDKANQVQEILFLVKLTINRVVKLKEICAKSRSGLR